jgi:hypothetical protein
MLVAPILVAAALAGVYLAWDPASADLAAQTFRTDLFEAGGFALWNNSWYAGHFLPGYSLLFPPLAALIGPRLVGALAAVAAAGLFAALAHDRFGERARLGALWFGAATATNLFTGRLTFALGVAIGLAALLALRRGRSRLAPVFAVLTSFASPVAGLFLAIAGAAVAIAARRAGGDGGAGWRPGGAVAIGATGAVIAMALAFPTDGIEPFVISAFQNVPIFAAVALVLIPGDERVLRWGIALYGIVAVALFVFDNAVGGNVTRLGALFAGPVMALALAGRRPLALAIVALPLLWWQWSAPIRDVAAAIGDPSVERSFHRPLVAELDRRTVGAPTRVQVLPTRNRWEAVYVAEAYPLARGWLRQAESDDFDLFQDGRLDSGSYFAWLLDHAVDYVAVPEGVELDYLATDEAELIDSGPPYLDPIWRNPDWRLYEVAGKSTLVTAPDGPVPSADARMAAIGPESFEVTADAPGDYLVRVRYSRYWQVVAGDACVERDGDWTLLRVRSASVVAVEARFSLGAMVGARDQCSG